MTINYRIRGWLFCGLLPLSVAVRAQPVSGAAAQPEPVVRATAMVDSIPGKGFYRIVLPPRLVAKCRADLSDLRILKPDGNEVPYVLRTKLHDPLNAGYLALPDPTIRRKDSSNKHSYYRLQYDDAYRIDRLSLAISDPVLYKREVRIMACGDSTDWIPVTSVSIDPHDTTLRLPAVKAQTLVIDIANGDNPPLTITRVASAQSGIYILTYLPGINHCGYKLSTGLGDYRPPDYDLHYFTDSLSRHPLDLGLQPIRLDTQQATIGRDTAAKAAVAAGNKSPIPASRKSSLLLWGILIIIGLLLLYVSIKLTKSIAEKENP